MNGEKYGPADVQLIPNLMDLHRLDLWDVNLSPEDLERIASLKELKSLELRMDSLSDAHVASLRKFSQLKELLIEKGRASDDAIQELKNSLPNCRVVIYKLETVESDGQTTMDGRSKSTN
jgi:hypothetical protein